MSRHTSDKEFTLIPSTRSSGRTSSSPRKEQRRVERERDERSNKGVAVEPAHMASRFGGLSLGGYDAAPSSLQKTQHKFSEPLFRKQPRAMMRPQAMTSVERDEDASLRVAQSGPLKAEQPRPAPRLPIKEIPTLKYPFIKPATVSLESSTAGITPGPADCLSLANAVMQRCFALFESVKPRVTYRQSKRNPAKITGSYTTPDLLSTADFDLRVWRIEGDANSVDYILECRCTGLHGKDAVRGLTRIIAGDLKTGGLAKKWCSGVAITSSPDEDEEEKDQPDLGELSMPTMHRRQSRRPRNSSSAPPPIKLNDSQISIWAKILSDQKFPLCAETLQLIAGCCVNEGNRELLSRCNEVLAAVCFELNSGIAPGSCLNALTIAQQLLTSRRASAVLYKNGLLGALAKSIRLHSGVRVGSVKAMRSQVIEETALQVLDSLIDACIGVKSQEAANVKKTLVGLKQDLAPHLAEQIGVRIKGMEKRKAGLGAPGMVAVC